MKDEVKEYLDAELLRFEKDYADIRQEHLEASLRTVEIDTEYLIARQKNFKSSSRMERIMFWMFAASTAVMGSIALSYLVDLYRSI